MSNVGDADALGKSLDGRDDPVLPTLDGALSEVRQYGCGCTAFVSHIARCPLHAAAPDLLAEGQETAAELEGLADWLDSIDAAAGIARKLRAIEKRWRAAIAKATQP